MTDRAMSVEAAVGELKGQLGMLISSMSDASDSRRRTHEKIDNLGAEIHSIRGEVRTLTKRVTDMEPSWTDYLQKQQQVRGAGTLGRAIWKAGGWLLAAAVALYGAYAWFVLHFTFKP